MARKRGQNVEVRIASGPKRAQQIPGDDVALDFGGAVPDAFNAGVAPETLNGEVIHQAHAAVDL